MKSSPSRTIAAVVCVSTLAFSACGDDDGDTTTPAATADTNPAAAADTQPPPVTAGTVDTSLTATTPAEGVGEDADDATPSTVPGTTAAVEAEAWRTAIGTAEAHARGTAYELDDQDDDGTWEIDVAVDDRSVEVTVDADGTQVVGTEDDDDLDDEDRQALAAATITLAEAIATALAEVPGTLDDVELDNDDGTFAWEVTIDAADDDDIEVYVDVTTGAVLRVERD